jgi:hypothetical protein
MHYEEERRAYAQVSKETCYRGKRDPVYITRKNVEQERSRAVGR